MDKLELFTDDELLQELEKRFDDFIMAGRKINTDQEVFRRRWWKGDMDVCAGLLYGAIQDCVNKNWGICSKDIDIHSQDEL